MKKIWAIRKDSEAVSPVIATILMVAITVVLAAVLYVMVLGFGGTTNTPAVNVLRKTSVTDGFKIEFTAPTSEVKWGDVTIQLTYSGGSASWTPDTDDLTGTPIPKSDDCGEVEIESGTFAVNVVVYDLSGNGAMSNGDYIIITTTTGSFSSTTTYTLTMLHEPTDGSMLSYEFTG